MELTPTSGSSKDGATINIAGELFMASDSLGCRLGDISVPAKFVSPTHISCTVLGPMAPVAVEVTITDNGVDFMEAGKFMFLPETTVTALNPSSGPFSAEGSVLLSGTSFSNFDRPSCSFGGDMVHAEVISPTEAMCTTPVVARSVSSRPTPLPVSVQFSNHGFDLNGEPDSVTSPGSMFTFYDEPLMSSLTPSGGVTNGGKSVVAITGANLAMNDDVHPGEDRLACRLGNVGDVTTGMVSNATHATCEVACGNFSGRASFEVSLNGGAHWTASDVGFLCGVLPKVESVQPPIGPVAGGTIITVRGSGFMPSAMLSCLVGHDQYGATPVPAVWISSSMLECSTPAISGALGGNTNSSVVITNDGVHFSEPFWGATFEYVLSPMVWRVSPSFASSSGSGTNVMAIGTNFINTSTFSCHLTYLANDNGTGGAYQSVSVPATFVSPTVTSCFVPGGVVPPGPARLAVSANGADFEESGAALELDALPQVFKVVPERGIAGTTVTPVEVRAIRAATFTIAHLHQRNTRALVLHLLYFSFVILVSYMCAAGFVFQAYLGY